MAAYSVFTSITHQSRRTETDSLRTISDGIPAVIRRTRTVPSSNTWSVALANELGLAANQVSETRLGNLRQLRVDPTAQVGPLGGSAGLPYAQAPGGASQPANLRMVVVTSAGAALPDFSAVTFSNLWSTAEDQLPTGWPSWGGQPADLRIERLELGPLFHRVILNNLDETNSAAWSIETASTNLQQLAPSTRREMWVIDTTVISLHDLGPVLNTQEILRRDASYVYQNGRWFRHLAGRFSEGGGCGPFGDLVDDFLAAPRRAGATQGNQQMVVDAMFHFMTGFTFWSRDGGCSPCSPYWAAPRDQLNNFRTHLGDAAAKLE